MKKQTKLLLLALAALCLLTACKKKDETLEVYSLGENEADNVVALDSILTEGEAILASVDAPTDAAVAERLDVSHTYHYRKIDDPALLADRYITILRSSEQGFVPIDTENRKTVDEPVTNTLTGSVILGKAAAATTESGGSRILRVVVGWSEYAVAVQVAYADGRIQPAPKPEEPAEEQQDSRPTSVSEQMDYFNSLDPRKLGLEGDNMQDYMVYPQQGWVLVNDIYCREMLVYLQDIQTATNVYIGSFYLSSDMSQVYQKNSDGQITLLDID